MKRSKRYKIENCISIQRRTHNVQSNQCSAHPKIFIFYFHCLSLFDSVAVGLSFDSNNRPSSKPGWILPSIGTSLQQFSGLWLTTTNLFSPFNYMYVWVYEYICVCIYFYFFLCPIIHSSIIYLLKCSW